MMGRETIAPAAGVGLLALAAWGYLQYRKNKPQAEQKIKILLDPGHEGAGMDPGAVRVVNGRQIIEAECNLGLALATKEYLAAYEFDAMVTRDRPTRLSIAQRKDIIRRIDPDIFVSIHHNAPPNDQPVFGTIVGVSDDEDKAGTSLAQSNRRLAGLIAEKIGKVVARGRANYRSAVRTDKEMSGESYGVLGACRNIGKPGVLVETAFLTDPVWQQARLEPSFGLTLAAAMGEAIMASVLTLNEQKAIS